MKSGQSKYVLDLRPQAAGQVAASPAPDATVDRGSVRRREETLSAKPKNRRLRTSRRRILIQAAKLSLLLAAAAGFLLLEIPLPERLIGAYFAASIIYAFDSQRTFIVALIFLVLVAGASAAGQSVPAQNYAVYAFYFLVIGLVAAIREQVSNRSRSDRGNSQLSD